MKILVTIDPFGNEPRAMLEGYNVVYNETGKKYSADEHIAMLKKHQPDLIVAGTEKYNKEVFGLCPNLKIIARAGVGVDAVDLLECKKRNIVVTYTPEASIKAVSELTIGQIFNALRKIQSVSGKWERYIGKSIEDCTVGVIGCGRIGSEVINKLKNLNTKTILINDKDNEIAKQFVHNNIQIASKQEILQKSNIITIHIPLKEISLEPKYNNTNYLTLSELNLMKEKSIIINTSRGGIINEQDLYTWLKQNPTNIAVLDVFEIEPYRDALLNLPNAYLTPHIGSCTEECRQAMEVGATKEILNFINQNKYQNRII